MTDDSIANYDFIVVGAGSAGSLTVAGRESAAAPRRPVRLSPESMTEDAFVAMGARPRGSE